MYCRMWHTQFDFENFADTLFLPPMRHIYFVFDDGCWMFVFGIVVIEIDFFFERR
jgi:hypothetical protein